MFSDSVSDDVNEIVEPNTPTVPIKPFESPYAEYSFMVAPIDLLFSESISFLPRSSRWFLVFLLFLIVWSLCLNLMYPHCWMCVLLGIPYISLPSLGVMSRVHAALHLSVAYIDNIIRLIAIYNDTYKFVTYSYSILQEFAVDSGVMVPSHPEVVRKLHAWCTDFDKSLKRSVSIAYESNSPWDPGINFVFSRDDAPRSTLYALIYLSAFTVNPSRRPVPPPPL